MLAPLGASDAQLPIAQKEQIRRLLSASFLAAHLGLDDAAIAIVDAAKAADPQSPYIDIARGYVDVLAGRNEDAIRHLADIADAGGDEAADALRVMALAGATGGLNDQARRFATWLEQIDENALPFAEGFQ